MEGIEHTTRDEIDFLEGLGNWHWFAEGQQEDARQRRVRLLENYAEAMRVRRRWGDLDQKQIRGYLEATLNGRGQQGRAG